VDVGVSQIVQQQLMVSGPRRADADTAASPKGGDPKLTELAREFEAMVMLQMLRQMRQSMLTDGEEDGEKGLGADTMRDVADLELARQLSKTGGFGLARVLQGALERQYGGSTAQAVAPSSVAVVQGGEIGPAAAATATTALEPAARSETDDNLTFPLPLDSTLTSPYGWRQDPFGAGVRFHAGVDIAAAYGREVPAVSDGRVEFAGEQGGYGLTVVVSHDGGIETRYAHLASLNVRQGDEVRAGSAVGRVGQTGRSTGPHLHFEVLQHGQPVNPEMSAARYASALKNLAGTADLSENRGSRPSMLAGAHDED
jgi:murein DD-endopeptidase MepM/ murein hydrolase activator NlpD